MSVVEEDPARNSSPTPVRDTQPRLDNEAVTEHGTIPGKALYDSPSPNSQPAPLNRADRSRRPTTRKLESQGLTPALSYPPASSQPPTSSRPTSSQPPSRTASGPSRSQKTSKRRAIIQSPESSDDETAGTGAGIPSKAKPSGHPPRPKPVKGNTTAAGSGQVPSTTGQQPIILEPGLARNLGNLIGIDIATASTDTLNDTIKNLSDARLPQVEASECYPQVHAYSPAPIPTLSKTGGYHRNQANLQVRSTQSKKRPGSSHEAGNSKRLRIDQHSGRDDDENMYEHDDSPPLPTPTLRTQLARNLPSGLTERLTATSISQPEAARTYQSWHTTASKVRGWAVTPVPEPRGKVLPRLARSQPTKPTTSSSVGATAARVRPIAPRPPPSPTAFKSADANSNGLSQPMDLDADVRTPAEPSTRQPNTRNGTQSETESEPDKPPARRPTNSDQPGQHSDRASGTATSTAQPRQPRQPPTSHESRSSGSDARTHTDDSIQRLVDILNGGGDQEALVDWAIHMAERRVEQTRTNTTSSNAQPTASSSRSQPSDLRHRLQTAARSRTPSQVQQHARYPRLNNPSTRPANPNFDTNDIEEILPEPNDILCAAAAASSGMKPPADAKWGLGKYPGTRRKVASRAIVEFLAVAAARGVYQPADILQKWALNCYRRAWKKLAPNEQYEDPPDDLLQTMALRVSWLRTKVKERIRHVIHYKFHFHHPRFNRRRKIANRQLFAQLFPNTFHCRDLVTDTNQYENRAFVSAICEALFWDRDTPFIRHHERFKVMPLPTVAFVLTMMQACLEEWQTGSFRPQDLHSPTQQPIFDAHLRGLIEYQRAAPNRMERFQCRWFKTGMKYAGVRLDDNEPEYCQPITRASQVRPDTPDEDRRQSSSPFEPEELDLEDVELEEPELEEPEEPKTNAAGRYTTKAKGKGRARDDSTDVESD
ncbi:hypothetical protein FRC07_014783 [Ceratobasidium sp. 392]|nr:hypothetical protein FRC07_014783 [Ceratobasidium sp. 392]